MAHPESTGRDQAGRFIGSGNPAGRPRGARHRTTLAAEALLLGEGEALTRKAIELALTGDTVALRLCMDRILPRRGRLLRCNLPELRTAADLPAAIASITQQVAAALLTAEEGAAITGMLESQRKAIEMVELERRIAALEARVENGGPSP